MSDRYRRLWFRQSGWEPRPGHSVADVIADFRTLSRELGRPFTFDFNSVTVMVEPDSDASLLVMDWGRALDGHIDKKIGPYPKPELTSTEQAA